MQIAVFHNIMWSKYKGGVFSAMSDLTRGTPISVVFTQIAETDGERVALGGVDLSYHRYPYELIFPGSYSGTSVVKRTAALAKRAWASKADVVVLPGYERVEYWAMLAVLLLRKKPRAVFCDSTAYDRPSELLKGLAKRLFFSACNGFFGYGIRSREYLMMHGASPERIFFRCQAAALPHDYSEAVAKKRRAANAPKAGAAPRFLYVGRLSPEKGLNTLLEAMQVVVRQRSDSKLVLAGAGALKQELLSAAEALGLTSNVEFLGSMDITSLSLEYAAATALVLPSTSEPWGLVVNEALSLGCPVIVSNACGCVPELVVPGWTGYVVQTDSASDLSEKMLAAVDTFTDAEVTADACITHMRQFTPEQAARQIVEGCKAIVSGVTRQAA